MTQGRRWWPAVAALAAVVVGAAAGALLHARGSEPARAPLLSPQLARCAREFRRRPHTAYRVRITHGVRPRLRAVDVARRARHDLGPLVVLDRLTASTTFWLPSVELGVDGPGDRLESVVWVARAHGCIVFPRAPGEAVFPRGYVVYDDRTGLAVASGTD